MTPPRLLHALCLLLLLIGATPLIATAMAGTGRQRPAQSPTLLWQTFPLREHAAHQHAAHQLAPTFHVRATARKANSERSVPAAQATNTFPSSVIIGLVAATMLAAVVLFTALRPQVLALRARTRPTGAEEAGERNDRGEDRPPQRVRKRHLRRIPLRDREIVEFQPPAVGHSAAEVHEGALISAGARTVDLIVAGDDRAETATDDIDAATSPTEQESATRTWALQQAPHSEPLPETPRPNVQPLGGNSKQEWEAAPERPGEQRTGIERCEILLWTGYVKKQFYAASLGASRTLETLATSSDFRLRDADVPSATAEHALEGLIARLENAGWQVVSRGARWYHYRLERLPPADGWDPRV